MDEFQVKLNPVKAKPVKQTLALTTMGACLLLGIVGAFLFDGQSWGINLALFGLLLMSVLLFLRKRGRQPLGYVGFMLVASGIFFVVALVWRDSLVLNSLSALGILLTINLAFTLGTRQRLQRLYVSEVFQDLFASSKYGITSFHDLITEDVRWDEVQQRWGQFGRAVLRGLMITIPLLVVFGMLLTASDARFEEMVHKILDWGWDAEKLMQYLATFIVCSWIAVAVLRMSVLNQGKVVQARPALPAWKLGSVEIVIVLGTLNILFLSFIATQFTYFFGGDVLVQSSLGTTYADYARRGFFQLVTVAFLVIALLLLVHWLYKPSSQLEKRLYFVFAAIMIVMTMIIETSAAYRMYLYTRIYGLTELRFYTSVFMLWLVILFLWFSVTVLRGQHRRFAFGAILTGMVFMASLHFVNPEAQIAQVNLARLQAGEKFDANYVTSLSADVIPPLLTALPSLSMEQRCILWFRLQSHPVLKASGDWRTGDWYTGNWRTWHWSRIQAVTLLSSVSQPQCHSLSIN